MADPEGGLRDPELHFGPKNGWCPIRISKLEGEKMREKCSGWEETGWENTFLGPPLGIKMGGPNYNIKIRRKKDE